MTDKDYIKNIQMINSEDSDESSSLKFLGSDKQQDDNNDIEEQPNLQAKKRARDWNQDNSVDKGPINGYKRRQRIQEEEANSDAIFLYKPGVELPNLFHFTNQTIKVIIAGQYVTQNNPAVLKRKLYGTDTYSSNSDCVCIALHFGLISFNSFVNKKYEGVQVIFKVVKPKKNYNGSLKNGLVSETIKNFNGNALKPESSRMLTSLSSLQNLQKYAANMRIPIGKARVRPTPQKISTLIPLPENHIVFDMHNEPAYKYSIYNIADKGFDKSQFLIRKLDHKVLYFETSHKQVYQLSKYIEKTYFEAYRFAKLKHPIKFDNQYFSIHSPPLQLNDVQILEALVEWDEIILGEDSIKVKETIIYNLNSFKFHNISPKQYYVLKLILVKRNFAYYTFLSIKLLIKN